MARAAATPTTYWFRKIAVGLIAACGTAMTLNAAGAAESLGLSAVPLRATGPAVSQKAAPPGNAFGKKRAAPSPNSQKALAPGEQQSAEANEPSRQNLRPANADDKEGAGRTAERTVRANAFPASIEELKKDRKLKVSDFRTLQPSATEVSRLMSKAATGPVRVIVTLKMLLTPEGLLGERASSEQRGTIALKQQQVLDDLKPQIKSGAMEVLRQFDVVPMLVLRLNAEALTALASHADVAAITEDLAVPPLLNASAPAMGSADARDRGFTGSGWNVAVLDTGIDRSHQFLRGFRAEACFSGNANCPNGATSQISVGAAAACTYSSGCFHGTHVSGIATGASKEDLTNREGAARGAFLIPVQVFSRFTGANCSDGVGPCALSYTSDQIAGLQYVFNQRGNFPIASANMSLGGGGTTVNCDSDTRKPIIDMLRSVNIATIISSGNNGFINGVTAPGCISSAISVGATDNDGNVASFSNIGNANIVDLVAPGVSVVSSCPYSMFATGFCTASGTSMSAPHVAGAWAVMQSQANQTVSFNEARLEEQALQRRDLRGGGVEMNLRGADVFDALASINRLTLSSDNPESIYRTPRPIPHTFNYTATRSSWSVAALRQSSGVDVDMVQCEGPVSDNCAISGSSSRGLYGDGVTTIDLIATNHNDGLRPFPETMGLRFNQFSTSSFAAPDDGFYGVQVSQARDIDFGSLYGTAFTGFGPRQILQVFESPPFSAGTRLYIRAVHEMPIELYAFSSDPADPASHVRGVGSADAAAINLSSGASEISFVQRADSSAGIVVVNRGGEGEVILYSDDTAPTGSVLINGGATTTSSPNVTLTLAADDGTTGILDMRVAVDGVADSEAWEPYITSKPVTLAQTVGTATVAVQFRNNAGMISAMFTDSITVQATPVVLNVADVAVVEGNSGTVLANVTVSLSAPSTERVAFRLRTSDGTALAGSDYLTRTTAEVTFAPGQTERVVAITVNGDTTVEPDENFFVTLNSPVNATIGDGQGVVTIVNDDAPLPTLSINDTSVAEGNSGTRNAVFTIRLSAAATSPVSVSFATTNGTATAGSDYTAVSGTASIPAGALTAVINVPVTGDTVVEPNETLFVNLSAPSGATLADAQGVATISNDDTALPTLSINDTSVAEGNSGTRNAVFTVTLSAAATSPVSVSFATANGTATAGSDYTAVSGTASIPAGALSATINVQVNGDTQIEPNETLFVNLSAPVGATIADGQGVATISNDDTNMPTLSINDTAVAEGNSGTRNAVFTVTLSAATNNPVSVNFASANGTAIAGSDYSAVSGTASIPPGALSATINVPVVGDTVVEPNETLFVNLSAPVGATIADSQGVATITNDDSAATSPGIGVNVSSFNFGNVPVGSSSVQRMLIISSTGTAPLAITSIRLAGDYVGSSGCPASLAPGATCALTGSFRPTAAGARPGSVTITSNAPSSPTVVQLMGTGTAATPAPSLSINDLTVGEFDFVTGMPTVATFTVRLSATAAGTVSVNYATANGTALSGSDFLATSGTLTFSAGQTTRTATVSLIDDNAGEPNETFSVALSNVVGSATIADGIGVATVSDDDFNDSGRPVTISNAVVTEGPNGQRQAVFYVAGPNDEADFFFSTSGGTATPGVDYTPVSFGISGNGDSNHVSTISINILGDTVSEPDETFFLTVTSADGTVLGQAQATIVNVDQLSLPSSFSIADAAVQPFPEFAEDTDTSQATLVVTRTGSVMFSQTVVVETQDGTAIAGTGYVASSMTLTFAPGESAKIVTVTVKPPVGGGDFFYVNLRNASNANIIDRQAVVAKDELT